MFQQNKKFQKGGSLYDYLSSTGRSKSQGFNDSRKALAKQLGISDYSGTAQQNTQLLSILQEADSRGVSPMSLVNKNVAAAPVNRQVSKNPNPLPAQVKSAFQPLVQGYKDYRDYDPIKTPESGVVVDKRTGQAYMMKGNKVVKQFPVLTGKDVDGEKSLYGRQHMDETGVKGKATPTGNYLFKGAGVDVNVEDMKEYNGNIMKAYPIEANGLNKPDAMMLGFHQTYDPAVRNKFYNSLTPYQSWGCVNGNCNDIKDVMHEFPRGDTMMVIDSKMPKFQQISKRLNTKQEGGSANIVVNQNRGDFDSIPSYLSYIKATQEGNLDGQNKALAHIQDYNGAQTATDLRFLANDMKVSNINDLARRKVENEKNPEMKRLYAMIHENPDIMDKFQFALPKPSPLIAKDQLGGMKKRGGWSKIVNPFM